MFTRPLIFPHTWEARIVRGDDGLYHGAEDGQGQLACGAMVHDDMGEAWGTVAWLRDKPETWWLGRFPFYPEKGWPPIMGAAEIVFASDMDCDLLLVRSPARWVELAATGPWPGPTACVLDWTRADAARLWLSLVKAVRCETSSLSGTVESRLEGKSAKRRLRVSFETPAIGRKEAA